MIRVLRGFVKSIPTLLMSLALAVAVWISAVNAADPVQQRLYPRQITIERVGLDSSLVILGDVPTQASVTLSAPSTIWDSMLNDRSPVRVWIDLAGKEPGTHVLDVNVVPLEQFQPSKVVNYSPRTVTVHLERLITKELKIDVDRRGEPAIGYQIGSTSLSQETVVVSGPQSVVDQVASVRVILDVAQASENINRNMPVQALNESGTMVDGVTITPAQVMVSQPVTQRGGYRNVAVKVVSAGKVASGYRTTYISVSPPTVTLFSTNPQLTAQLPGYVETSPLDLTGIKDDLDIRLSLNLPDGVEVVGEQTVSVQVGVSAIEGSVTLSGLPVEITGLPQDLSAHLSPETVDVILSGPVPLLDSLTTEDLMVTINLSEAGEGTYQLVPKVSLAIAEMRVESILPSSIEVVVFNTRGIPPTPTPTRTPTPTATLSP
jgi:YbbR domain-containing protein